MAVVATRDLTDADEQISRALAIRRDYKPALRLRREPMNRNSASAEQVSRELANLPDKHMWAAYGRILFGENRIDEAVTEFRRQLAVHSDAPELRNEYAQHTVSGISFASRRKRW